MQKDFVHLVITNHWVFSLEIVMKLFFALGLACAISAQVF